MAQWNSLLIAELEGSWFVYHWCAHPGFDTQPCDEVPGDPRVE